MAPPERLLKPDQFGPRQRLQCTLDVAQRHRTRSVVRRVDVALVALRIPIIPLAVEICVEASGFHVAKTYCAMCREDQNPAGLDRTEQALKPSCESRIGHMREEG